MTLPGPNLRSGANSCVPNSGQQGPGLHNNQDPGFSSDLPHQVFAHPVFYIQAPPPPTFLHYHWPMPFSFNPGFPGMGYGVVMPPAPAPFIEAPAYILPHPPVQAVDYRRLLQPQVHAPTAPYQNPNQTFRIRPPHTGPVRETVNSEVQTEPTHRGVGGYGGFARSDSGHGTASSSPSSSSSSQKQSSAEVENYTLPKSNTENFQVNRTSTSNSVKHGFSILHHTEKKTALSHVRATQETQKSCKDNVGQDDDDLTRRNSHCNIWSVSTPDSIVPVCSSSQQENAVFKERRESIPDILMSWGGGTQQATMMKLPDKVQPHNDHQLLSSETELGNEKSAYEIPSEAQNDPGVADNADANDDAEGKLSCKHSEILCKILKLPFAPYDLSDSRASNELVELIGSVGHCLSFRDELLQSLNKSHKLSEKQENGSETKPHEDTAETIPYQLPLNSCKINESVWSVESLAPFIPSKEWLLQNGMVETEVIVEMTEEAENCGHSTQNDLIVKASKKRETRRFSSSDSVPMSDSWLTFSTPAEKLCQPEKPELKSEMYASEMTGPKQGQSMAPSEKDPLVSSTRMQSKIIVSSPTVEEGVDENRSSEPEANQSPNQESLIGNEKQEKSRCPPEQEATLLLSSAAGEEISPAGHLAVENRVDTEVKNWACGKEEVSQLINEKLFPPVADERMVEVSPSKGHLVDCGIQCTELQGLKCFCEELKGGMGPNRRHPYKYSGMKKANNDKTEGFCMNGQQKRHNQRWNRGSGPHSSQQEAYYGYSGKPGKSKGGNGRNPRH
ncbi:uncharacterized protein LOC108896761 [Lates calcarifer]|uniref:Uncharacterized protein LOC108896761 n=1 Tax=Lates calcarifer TaxID=8187 RepID=A0AAJ7VFP5_LATCA|nr:uncharacterized protein LOC108896761 [Lates calcarifer]